MRKIVLLMCLFAVFGCKKKEGPKPPEQVQLLFPEKNSECTTGIDQDATTSRVTFEWQTSDNTDSYELRVTNISSNTVQTISTQSTTATLPLLKGQPYSWLVRSRNDQVDSTISSEMWSFYNAGSSTTFAPFPAEILAPSMSERVFKDINNEVTLSWSASDLDDDIENIEVYFSEQNPPTELEATLSNMATTFKVSVISGTIYYWSVTTRDAEGNATSSGTYSFSVL